MMGSSVWTLMRIILHGKSSGRFIFGVVLSFAFSISVILGTIGIMDGFDDALKKGLKKSSGDLLISHQRGFFDFNRDLRDPLQKLGVIQVTPIVQTEGFAVYEELSRGVVIKGVEPESFNLVTGLQLNLLEDEVALGEELHLQLGVKKGQSLVIVFANGQKGFSSLPLIRRFRISDPVKHGIYKKDLRFAYVHINVLQEILNLGQVVNLVSANAPLGKTEEERDISSQHYSDRILDLEQQLQGQLGPSFQIRPFWREFDPLIEAVQVEKVTIGLILQIMVVISIFNVLSFVIFLNEKKSQEIFLFQSLGLSKKKLFSVWLMVVLLIWSLSCALSIFLAQLFDYGLQHLSILQLPGDIYNLGRLSLKLGVGDYIVVFALALFWIFVIAMVGIARINRKSILSGLRKEFS